MDSKLECNDHVVLLLFLFEKAAASQMIVQESLWVFGEKTWDIH